MSEATGKFSCPSCGKRFTWKRELAGKSGKCKCGATFTVPDEVPGNEADDVFDLASEPAPKVMTPVQTVRAPQTTVARPTIAAPPVLRRAQVKDEDTGSVLRKFALPLVLVAVIGLVAVGGGVAMSHHAKVKASKSKLGDDPIVEEMLDSQFPDEFNHWMKASVNRMVMGMSNNQASALVDSWYKMGAKKVIAFGGGLTMSLVIELPDEKEKRKPLFAWENEHHYDWGKPPAKDVGQRYLLIKLQP